MAFDILFMIQHYILYKDQPIESTAPSQNELKEKSYITFEESDVITESPYYFYLSNSFISLMIWTSLIGLHLSKRDLIKR